MTTIAYRDGVIASDTLVSAGGTKVGRVQKIGKIGPVLFGASGSLAQAQRFGDWVRGGMKGAPPQFEKEEGEGFVIHKDCIVTYSGAGIDRMSAPYFASGSGWQFALGAMAAGACAEQAVRLAITLDNGSGGEVTVLSRD